MRQNRIHDFKLTMAECYLVAQLGARMHYAVPRMLSEAGMLSHFYTDFWASSRLWRRSPGRILSRIGSRTAVGLADDHVTDFPMLALKSAILGMRIQSEDEYLELWMRIGKEFCNKIAACDFKDATGVYAFNSAGLELLRVARRRGLFAVIEQTIAPKLVEDQLLQEERRVWTGWSCSKPSGGATGRFAEREAEEWAAADLILCGSEFVRSAVELAGGPAQKCAVVPYGVDIDFQKREPRHRRAGELNVLFCGSVGLRKGVQYLLAAARSLPASIKVRVVGPLAVPRAVAADIAARCELVGAVPRRDIGQHYSWADVFVLPSICEGSATVCYEALAYGLPVITTANAGSVVCDGVNGFVIPVRSAGSLAERLSALAWNEALLHSMSRSALESATLNSVAAYRHRLITTLVDRRFGNQKVQ